MVSIFLLGYRGGWTPLRRNRITARRCAYVLADNKLALNAGRDLEMLSLEIGELGEAGFDLSLTGFDAAAATAFSTPTINGYKRYMPNSRAPNHIVWAYDNRAAMVRVVGQPGDAFHAAGKPCGGTGRKSVSLHGLADCRGSGWHRDSR